MDNNKKVKILAISLILFIIPFLVVLYIEKTRALSIPEVNEAMFRPFDPYVDTEIIKILKVRQEK